ncbi:hypothetical protein HXX76_011394 [Chlamydomonas incerta]|uniref:Uncharacterized protein n=1 Tax=Chlamydomonas incerta TaxID=51695 RepID=A0A835SUV3_CHLIN|nr:hypothetical protein HXX76_011394 [Chlamydomonas incerta]|eukprot:KAG2428689.1 hypothetical protein HXX76_011394 [Chlamydomonas incerta]
MQTCTKRPGYCCFSLWCGYCASYGLRKQALHGDMSRYLCCNGMCPCSGRMGERKCPEFCLCMEVACCFAQSVATTRWMIQDELQVETTQCDNCIIGTMIALQYLSCICHILACFFDELHQVAQFVDCLADVVWCSVCACMQTQHKAELDHRDANPHAVPPPLPGMQAPGVQMIPMAGHPPPGAYPPPPGAYPPPPPGYGAPHPGGYAPPPPGAYAPPPPGAYPPQAYPYPPPPGSQPGMHR